SYGSSLYVSNLFFCDSIFFIFPHSRVNPALLKSDGDISNISRPFSSSLNNCDFLISAISSSLISSNFAHAFCTAFVFSVATYLSVAKE
ncbi:hypothetical protein ACN091_10345, partial [Aliarcobacter butzleri]|uniref:hypothetical protein n=1 Tax=Aliarcobacter butzleri TaxID=28197 RepID=UPI003AE2AEFF